MRRRRSLPILMHETEQRLGDAGLEMEEGEIFDLLVGPPDPLAQYDQQLKGEFGPALEQRQQRPARYDQQLAIGRGRRVGGTLLAVEQGDLAEHVAFAKRGEDRKSTRLNSSHT